MKTVHKDVYVESTTDNTAAENNVKSPDNRDQECTTGTDLPFHNANQGDSSFAANNVTASHQNDRQVDVHYDDGPFTEEQNAAFTEQCMGDTQLIMLQDAFSNV